MSNKELYHKAENIYLQYTTMLGCNEEELDTVYNELTELSKTTKDIEVLTALHLLLKVKSHRINGVIIQNGVRVEYTVNESGVVTANIG